MASRKPDSELQDMIKCNSLRTSCGCWIWLQHTTRNYNDGQHFSNAYGRTWDGCKKITAHRLAYEVFMGRIPKGLLVRHTCDIPQCCNPRHLELGTKKDNVSDMMVRGRHAHNKGKHGTESHFAVLTESDVLEIRRRYAEGTISQRLLGLDYGVSQTAVLKIVRRQRWEHI